MLKKAVCTMALCLCCAHAAQAQTVVPDRKPVVCESHPLQSGIASVYANLLDGGRTASGETFRQTAFTAAHMTLPFNTLLEVKDVRTGRSVMVRVNDRGPYASGRIIDLTSAARRALGHNNSGLYNVTISRCDGGS